MPDPEKDELLKRAERQRELIRLRKRNTAIAGLVVSVLLVLIAAGGGAIAYFLYLSPPASAPPTPTPTATAVPTPTSPLVAPPVAQPTATPTPSPSPTPTMAPPTPTPRPLALYVVVASGPDEVDAQYIDDHALRFEWDATELAIGDIPLDTRSPRFFSLARFQSSRSSTSDAASSTSSLGNIPKPLSRWAE